MPNYGPFDVGIRNISIVSPSGNATDIQYITQSMAFYENLLLPVTYGQVSVHDGLNLIDKLPITGFDSVMVEFKNPLAQGKALQKTFRIYNIVDRRRTSNSGQNYTIQFCSEELFMASQYLVSKSYQGKTVADMIRDICTQYLKIKADRLDIDATKGMFDIIIPFMKPFEAINYVGRKALSSKGGSPSFLFWETLLDGFKFKPLDDLIQKGEVAEYIYQQAKVDASEHDPFEIVQYDVLKNFDTITDTQSGKFAANLQTLDMIRQVTNTVVLDNSKFFKSEPHLDGGSNKMVERENRKTDTPNIVPDSHSRLLYTTLDQQKAPYIQPRQPTIKPLNIEQTELQRNSLLLNFHDLKLTITVPGNMTLKCGDVVSLILPSLEPQGGGPVTTEGLSGRYLIARLTHEIVERKFVTRLGLVKDDTKAKNFTSVKSNPVLIGLMGL